MHRSLVNHRLQLVCAGLVLIFGAGLASGQTLGEKLIQRADFLPTAGTPEARLIEVAQHYKIPMGIEWFPDGNEVNVPSLLPQPASIQELLTNILRDAPGYQWEIEGGMVMVGKAPWSKDARNFLNIQLTEYRIDHGNVIHAEAALLIAIHATLHPEKYGMGYTGGYGYGDLPETFRLQNISINARKVTVRKILNAIVQQNGNCLWVVNLLPSTRLKSEVYFAGGPSVKEARTDFSWRILPFQ